MFEDNKSLVSNTMDFHTKLHKRHNELFFHRLRESVAADVCSFHYLPGELNLVDLISQN